MASNNEKVESFKVQRSFKFLIDVFNTPVYIQMTTVTRLITGIYVEITIEQDDWLTCLLYQLLSD